MNLQIPENFNANINECIKAVENIGWTHYVNICTGQTVDVPWGTFGLVAGPLFVLVMIIVAVVSFRILSHE